MNELAQLISTVGFPIFSFLLAGWGLKYVYDKERKSLDNAVAQLSELTQAVNHNSEVIVRLADNIKKESEDTHG